MSYIDRSIEKEASADNYATIILNKHQDYIKLLPESYKTSWPHCYIVTTDFNMKKEDELEPEISINFALSQSKRVYNHICNIAVKNNKRKQNKKYLPAAISFVDFPNSRNNKPYINSVPHLHCVYILHPVTIDRFKSHIGYDNYLQTKHSSYGRPISKERTPNLNFVQKVHCEPVEQTYTDLFEAIDYSSKLIRKVKYLPLDRSKVEMLYLVHNGLYT